MATNLALDNSLLIEAQKVGNFKTKKDTVNTALLEFIQRHKQLGIVKLFGKIEYHQKYDYKKGRERT
ncbi:MAG TPA: type II toxin-antitoxin system VapB family antitoxin [Candidatus Cloacimonetes bacterium]|nr:type II toxin-antitoxin system VapB family antitoxin [Candidatus Cloacimonadota bacterium]